MTITSFEYITLIAIGTIIYYIFPKKWQWIELVILSMVFYYLSVKEPATILFPIFSTITAYLATSSPLLKLSKKSGMEFIVVITSITLNLVLWFVLKGSDIYTTLGNHLLANTTRGSVTAINIPAALGMSYYTAQVISYILDCHWKTAKPQKNPLKLFLFITFFPQLTTGPISKYQELTSLYEGHKFSYNGIALGTQRILWGFFKKLVLAERLGIVVHGIYAAPDVYTGIYLWIAALLYPIQIYADFSGCVDICIGTAELFGVKMPENFNNPLFSRSSEEFWRRWHITLGRWAKDYIFYPFLKTKTMAQFGQKMKKKFGKRIGKLIPMTIAMLFVWLTMGTWHGGFRYIVGVSLWYWFIIMLGEWCKPFLEKINKLLSIPTESFSWNLFQSIRTYLILTFGSIFFSAESLKNGIQNAKAFLSVPFNHSMNPWILFDGSILNLGITERDIHIIVISVIILLIAGIIREKYGHARIWIQQQWVLFRWSIWIFLFVMILVFGKYGTDYNAAEFIYRGF